MRRPNWPTTPRDILAPRIHEGILQYRMMELAAPTEAGSSSNSRFWTLRDKEPSSSNYYVTSGASAAVSRPPPALPVTSAMPSVTLGASASTGFDVPTSNYPTTAPGSHGLAGTVGQSS